MIEPRPLLRDLFDTAVAAASPQRCLSDALDELLADPRTSPRGRTVVLGAGKAAAAMARAVEERWPRKRGLEGLVVTARGHGVPCERIRVVEASHPVPDAAGERAAREVLELARGLGPDDLCLCLLSGGGSALLTLPAPGLELAALRQITRRLLASGVTIGEINTVRKHLSSVAGGQLAAAVHPARLVTMAISDVPGDDPAVIASGPTVGDPTTVDDARAVLEQVGVEPPRHLRETPDPDDPRLATVSYRIVASAATALAAAARRARELGMDAEVISDRLEGEAREVGRALAREAVERRRGLGRPLVLLSGGEVTVTLSAGAADGTGGPSGELALAFALELERLGGDGIHLLAADTDGIDGASEAAGATVDGGTAARARELGLDPAAALERHDSHGLLTALGESLVTGPTRTNVNDFRAVSVLPRKETP